MLPFGASKGELRSLALAELTAVLARGECEWASLQPLLRLCPELPARMPREYDEAVDALLASATSDDDCGAPLRCDSVLSAADARGYGVSALEESSEAAVLATLRFMAASRGAHLERLLPFALRVLLALPFFRWRHDHRKRAEAFAYAVARALTEVAIA